MSVPWLKNTFLRPFGFDVTEAEMKDIPYPLAELTIHITQRTSEAGAFLGGMVAMPLYRLRHMKTGDRAIVRIAARKLAGRFAIGGVLAGPLMTYAVVQKKGIDEDGLYDRCYRLRYNQGQVFVDGLVTPIALGGLFVRGVYGFTMASNVGLASVALLKSYNQYVLNNPPEDAPVPGVPKQEIVTSIDAEGNTVETKVGGKSEWTNNWKDEAGYKLLRAPKATSDVTAFTGEPRNNPNCTCVCHS